ncbi:DnaA ATPase domain-containing protein [Aquimarina macrocephali]|uniref:DnaA ATPase domain-containing protein n=1 Tax=Aquimarina macrocephali TaxID=666563 RepID=UPI003F675DAE
MTNHRKAIEALRNLAGSKRSNTDHDVYVPLKRDVIENDFKLTKSMFWKLWKYHSKDSYEINLDNDKVVKTIFRYFLKQEDFNEYGLIKSVPSLEKGLLIYGNYGIGKSLLFEILHKIGKELVTKRNDTSLWFNCISSGAFVDEYMRASRDKESTFSLKHYYTGKLYIDDLGFENKAFNKTEVFAELLFERNKNNAITYVTTNHKPSEITERYGERIGDRLPEMFNIIKWEGKSFRK